MPSRPIAAPVLGRGGARAYVGSIPSDSENMPQHFTVDVEEYFHPTSLERWVPRSTWSEMPRRASRSIHRLLDVLAEKEVSGTFFVLGWLAEREPELVRTIASAGHEIASHGWSHSRVADLGRDGFRDEARRSKGTLEDLVGSAVIGFRAPSFSIVPGLEWAMDILLEEGYVYDSSLFPVRVHPTYGYPCERDPHTIRRPAGTLVEVPPSTLRMFGENLPASGGAYFRLMPYPLLRAALRGSERRGSTGTFYIHPWELDGELPSLPIPWRAWLRTRGRTGDPWQRVSRLLEDFEFRRIDETVRLMTGRNRSEHAA